MSNIVGRLETFEVYLRGESAPAHVKLVALGYTFAGKTFCWKDGDRTKTRADIIEIADLHVVPGTLDGPHQHIKFSGPRAIRDGSAVENDWNTVTDVAAVQVANDSGLTERRVLLPVTTALNLIPNSLMAGAVDSTPGPQALPTGWVDNGPFNPEILSVDTTSEAENIVLRVVSPGADSMSIAVVPTPAADIAAEAEDRFRFEVGLQIVGGDLTNVGIIGATLHGFRADGTTPVDFNFLFSSSFNDGWEPEISAADPDMYTAVWEQTLPAAWATGANLAPNDIKFIRYTLTFAWSAAATFDIKVQRPLAGTAVSSKYDRRPTFLGHNMRPVVRPKCPDINDPTLQLRGSNLASADFGNVRGSIGADYMYPYKGTMGTSYTTIGDMVARGFNCFRFPFKAGRLQRSRLGAFNATDQTHIIGTVKEITDLGAYCVLDPHDFGSFGGGRIGNLDMGGTISHTGHTSTTFVLAGTGNRNWFDQDDSTGGSSNLDDWFNGYTITLQDGSGQSRNITDSVWDDGTRKMTLTVDPAWTVTPADGAPYSIPGAGPSSADLVDFWNKLATLFKDNPLVIFGLQNEPTSQSRAEEWYPVQQAIIDGIRTTVGATNMIFAVGVNWDGAHSWADEFSADGRASANDVNALTITDPLNNTVWEVHQYFNSNSSGIDPDVVPIPELLARMDVFTDWARLNGKRGFMGEFGTLVSTEGRAAMAAFLAYMEANADVWIGYAGWSQGPWWSVTYQNYFELNDAGGLEEFHAFQGV